jgi:uncharacterized protein
MPTISLQNTAAPIFNQMLGGLTLCLDKAATHCETKKIDPNAILTARLYPDMFNLIRQVQIACDSAKGAMARLAGIDVPKHEDTEMTFADLKKRIAVTLEFVNSVPADKLTGAEDREITLPLRSGPLTFNGLAYLNHFALPNFYFHVTTAYDILRHNGVEIGKGNYLGKP